MTMPTVDLAKIQSPEAKEIISSITTRNDTLYASKPSKANGREKYVWRIIAMLCSPKCHHKCFPVTASFDLQSFYEKQGHDSYKAYELTKQYIEDSKSIIEEIEQAFSY